MPEICLVRDGAERAQYAEPLSTMLQNCLLMPAPQMSMATCLKLVTLARSAEEPDLLESGTGLDTASSNKGLNAADSVTPAKTGPAQQQQQQQQQQPQPQQRPCLSLSDVPVSDRPNEIWLAAMRRATVGGAACATHNRTAQVVPHHTRHHHSLHHTIHHTPHHTPHHTNKALNNTRQTRTDKPVMLCCWCNLARRPAVLSNAPNPGLAACPEWPTVHGLLSQHGAAPSMADGCSTSSRAAPRFLCSSHSQLGSMLAQTRLLAQSHLLAPSLEVAHQAASFPHPPTGGRLRQCDQRVCERCGSSCPSGRGTWRVRPCSPAAVAAAAAAAVCVCIHCVFVCVCVCCCCVCVCCCCCVCLLLLLLCVCKCVCVAAALCVYVCVDTLQASTLCVWVGWWLVKGGVVRIR